MAPFVSGFTAMYWHKTLKMFDGKRVRITYENGQQVIGRLKWSVEYVFLVTDDAERVDTAKVKKAETVW